MDEHAARLELAFGFGMSTDAAANGVASSRRTANDSGSGRMAWTLHPTSCSSTVTFSVEPTETPLRSTGRTTRRVEVSTNSRIGVPFRTNWPAHTLRFRTRPANGARIVQRSSSILASATASLGRFHLCLGRARVIA